MARWLTSEAKQQFSEVVRRSSRGPQEIFRRNQLVAAVISAEDFQEFERFRELRSVRTLDRAFGEVRELTACYDYELPPIERRDRATGDDEST